MRRYTVPNEPYVTISCINCGKLRVYRDYFGNWIRIVELPKFCDDCGEAYLASYIEYIVPTSEKGGNQ